MSQYLIRILPQEPTNEVIYTITDGEGDYEVICPVRACDYIRQGTPFQVAINDPNDLGSHFESNPQRVFKI